MQRREFLKFTGGGIAAIALGGAGGWSLFRPRAAQAAGPIDLTMVEADHEMVDGVTIPAWAFSTTIAPEGGTALGPRIPGPVLFVTEGDQVTLSVANTITRGGEHGFEIVSIPETRRDTIPNDGVPVDITFTAPSAGTYMYLDPRNAPVNRVMGLHGAMIVLPRPVANQTPYSNPTQAVRNLFADFGVADHFPGHPWDRERSVVWVFSVLDPNKHALANSGSGPIDPSQFTRGNGYLPQYFTINGKSGFFAAQHGGEHHSHVNTPDSQANTSIHGHVGQPLLIRTMNAGLMWQSPHIHGNHVYELFEYTAGGGRKVLDNLQLIDTWTLAPEAICDQLLPYISPPDIPPNFWGRVAADTNQELLPLLYPMHDHQEVSNTAAGGNYPMGAATHWQIDGFISPLDEVVLVDRAELRVRTGEVLLEGRISASGVTGELMIHAGPTDTGPVLGMAAVTPGAQGLRNWSFRGRALQALATRQVSIHTHAAGSHAMLHGVPLTVR